MPGFYFQRKVTEIQDDGARPSELNLSGQSLSNIDIINLINALDKLPQESSDSLRWLYLSNNSLDDTAARLLSDFYLTRHIEKLDLSSNAITAKGADFLKSVRVDNLDLSDNPIKNEGAKALAKAESVRILTLDNCEMNEIGALHLIHNPYFEYLDISFNLLEDLNKTLIKYTLNKTRHTWPFTIVMNVCCLKQENFKDCTFEASNDTEIETIELTWVHGARKHHRKLDDKSLKLYLEAPGTQSLKLCFSRNSSNYAVI